jgi:hypothetical protein
MHNLPGAIYHGKTNVGYVFMIGVLCKIPNLAYQRKVLLQPESWRGAQHPKIGGDELKKLVWTNYFINDVHLSHYGQV